MKIDSLSVGIVGIEPTAKETRLQRAELTTLLNMPKKQRPGQFSRAVTSLRPGHSHFIIFLLRITNLLFTALIGSNFPLPYHDKVNYTTTFVVIHSLTHFFVNFITKEHVASC